MKVCVFVLCALIVVCNLPKVASEEEGSDLGDELAKLGISAEDGVKDAAEEALGGAQGDILIPDPPASAMIDDEDFEEDDEPGYLNLKDQDEIYEKGGDVGRLVHNNFDEQVFNGAQEMTLVTFYSKWCKECQAQGASIRATARRYRDDPKVQFFAVNQESGNYELATRFDTEPSEPTIFFTVGRPEVDGDLKVYEGDVSYASLLQFVESRGKDMVKSLKFEPKLYQEEGIAVKTDVDWNNFNDTVFDSKKNVMVQFYAGWSEFCKNDARNYTVLANTLRSKGHNDALIVAVDTDVHERLADRYDVQGLPAYWFAAKNATKDTDLLKYTGDHGGAIVIEEAVPFVNSGGTVIPDGMKHEHPMHPKPWEEIQKAMADRDRLEEEKKEKERKEQEERAKERREKIGKKKKALEEKKQQKKDKAAGKEDL